MRSQPGEDLRIPPATRDTTVVFLHVPKTAGMTMRQIIERNYRSGARLHLAVPPGSLAGGMGNEVGTPGRVRQISDPSPGTEIAKLAGLPEERKQRLRIIYGHTIFGVHQALPGPAAYVTMLREPMARVLSTYHFLRRRRSHWLHEQATKLSLEEFVRSWIARKDNLQTRIVSGELAGPDRCTEETLEHAKRNVDEHFAAVGLTERFDETVLLWGEVLGWRKLRYVPRNMSREGPRDPVPADVIRLIEELNELDRELYRFVKERFEKDLARYPSLEGKMARYRRQNALFQKVYPAQLKPFLRKMKRAVLR
jgi:hypothetical protein